MRTGGHLPSCAIYDSASLLSAKDGEPLIRQLCSLTRLNMNAIIPSGASEEVDNRQWWSAFEDNARRGTRYIIAMREEKVIGYIAYTVRPSTDDVYWNEYQIHPDNQRRGWVFRELLALFASELQELKETFVRTYANRRNMRSQALLEKLGFQVESSSARGLRYLMRKDELLLELERRAIWRSRKPRSAT